jgi:hypothetical protein
VLSKDNNGNSDILVLCMLLSVIFFLFVTLFSSINLKQSERFLPTTSTMYRPASYFFLPLINALVNVQIQRNALYHPNSSGAIIRNTSLSNNASIQSCIWECVYEPNCQTAVYFHHEKICSTFSELCATGSFGPSGNVQASVICYRKNPGEFSLCIHDV